MENKDYEKILEVLSRAIQDKETQIILDQFEISRLKKKIEDLETEIENAKSKYPATIELRKG